MSRLHRDLDKDSHKKYYDGGKVSSARHTVPDVGRRKGPAAIQHEGQVVWIIKCKSRKRSGENAGHGWIHSANACFRCGRLVSCLRDLQRSDRKVAAAAFTFSSPSPVQFTICSWKNVDVELPNVNACS